VLAALFSECRSVCNPWLHFLRSASQRDLAMEVSQRVRVIADRVVTANSA